MRSYELIDSVDSTPDPLALHKQQVRYLRWAIVQTMAALGLVVLACLLVLTYVQVQGDVTWLSSQALGIEERLASLNTPSAEVQALQSEIERVDGLIAALEAAQVPDDPHWPAVVSAIGRYDHQHITLTSLTQTNTQLTLTGRATGNEVVGDYARSLEAEPVFASMDIQSLRQVSAPPATAAPSSNSEQERQQEADALPPRTVEFVLTLMLTTAEAAPSQPDAAQPNTPQSSTPASSTPEPNEPQPGESGESQSGASQ